MDKLVKNYGYNKSEIVNQGIGVVFLWLLMTILKKMNKEK